MESHKMSISTLTISTLFGTNFLFWLLFQTVYCKDDKNGRLTEKNKKEKELSKPFVGTLECLRNLTSELFRTGLILALTYVCENHWIFTHSGKQYSRDMFIFILIIFFGYGLYTIKPVTDLTLLSREQTEEWKGWMQFIFLLYHYFHAEEVYNSVRVMITCYVWMTGFGNFSFFYIKRDYSWLRIVQMLWRLNFAVLLLMWTNNNTYILYYICPMHTFYFLFVYFTMYICSSINHTKYDIRYKLLVVGIIIYIIWDFDNGLFDLIFGWWLGKSSVIGASRGSLWEYYFRTSLDHWSSYLGMIFALNFPLAEQYFHKAKGGYPLVFASVCMVAITLYWFYYIYSLEKLKYNLIHSYTAIIPLSSYIFFRNLTPFIRSGVSMSLHDLGKTTLETYLLQHHIWLTSNAKTLLTLVPNYPYINFALTTLLFFTVAKELYRLTLSLRGMLLPDNHMITLKNCFGICITLLSSFIVASCVHAANINFKNNTYSNYLLFFQFFVGCSFLFFAGLLLINGLLNELNENFHYQKFRKIFSIIIGITSFIGIIFCIIIPNISPSGVIKENKFAADSLHKNRLVLPNNSIFFSNNIPLYNNNANNDINEKRLSSPEVISYCTNLLSSGIWKVTTNSNIPCNNNFLNTNPELNKNVSKFNLKNHQNVAYCETAEWNWENSPLTSSLPVQCPVPKRISTDESLFIYQNKRIIFAGDSIIRNIYHQFNSLLDVNYNADRAMSSGLKHVDLHNVVNKQINDINITISISFFWLPYVKNLSRVIDLIFVNNNNQVNVNYRESIPINLLISGIANWEALNNKNTQNYQNDLNNFVDSFNSKLLGKDETTNQIKTISVPILLWIQPTLILSNLLPTKEKQIYMNEEIIATYRNIFLLSSAAKLFKKFGSIINTTSVTDIILTTNNKNNHYDIPLTNNQKEQYMREHNAVSVISTKDGIHYTSQIYSVINQIISNIYLLHASVLSTSDKISNATLNNDLSVRSEIKNNSEYFASVVPSVSYNKPRIYSTSTLSNSHLSTAATTRPSSSINIDNNNNTKLLLISPKPTGSMSFPIYGFFVLMLSCVMLFSMDSFLGFGYLSLYVFNKQYDWEEAYLPIFRKNNIFHGSFSTSNEHNNATESSTIEKLTSLNNISNRERTISTSGHRDTDSLLLNPSSTVSDFDNESGLDLSHEKDDEN